MTLLDPTVGVFSTLIVDMTITHEIPIDGMIEITLPKWNSFTTISAYYESLIVSSFSPGEVSCFPQLGISTKNGELYCEFEEGTTSDTLKVLLENELSSAILAGS